MSPICDIQKPYRPHDNPNGINQHQIRHPAPKFYTRDWDLIDILAKQLKHYLFLFFIPNIFQVVFVRNGWLSYVELEQFDSRWRGACTCLAGSHVIFQLVRYIFASIVVINGTGRVFERLPTMHSSDIDFESVDSSRFTNTRPLSNLPEVEEKERID